MGDWLAARHDKYNTFMKRVQKMIATITLAEKEEREKDKQIRKAMLGYDPDVWLKADAQIRDKEQEDMGNRHF